MAEKCHNVRINASRSALALCEIIPDHEELRPYQTRVRTYWLNPLTINFVVSHGDFTR